MQYERYFKTGLITVTIGNQSALRHARTLDTMERPESEPCLIQTLCRPNAKFYRNGTCADPLYDSCLQISDNEINVREEGGANKTFTDVFTAFAPAASQGDVYEQISTAVSIADVVNGFNSTVIAYGQTGAGKVNGAQSKKSSLQASNLTKCLICI